MILPPDNPKLRAAAEARLKTTDLRSPAEIHNDEMLKEAQKVHTLGWLMSRHCHAPSALRV